MASHIPEQTIVINEEASNLMPWQAGGLALSLRLLRDGPTHQEPSVFGNGCWNHEQYAIEADGRSGYSRSRKKKKEYVKRRDYIIERMSALGFGN